MQDQAKWYIIHTYSGYENKVASTLETTVKNRGLQHMIQKICIPTENVTEVKDNKSRTVDRKVFPGYVLVKMIVTDDTWYIVRNIRGCTGFVGATTTPIPLTDAEVARLGVEKQMVGVPYSVGDSVRVNSGPLEDFVGIVEKIDTEKGCVKVVVSMFSRETTAELELDQVELVD